MLAFDKVHYSIYLHSRNTFMRQHAYFAAVHRGMNNLAHVRRTTDKFNFSHVAHLHHHPSKLSKLFVHILFHANTMTRLPSLARRLWLFGLIWIILCTTFYRADSFTVSTSTSSSSASTAVWKNDDDKRPAPQGLYVHIPFCRRRCRYCDFAIVPIGNLREEVVDDNDNIPRAQQTKLLFQTYTDAIVQEIRSLAISRNNETDDDVDRKVCLETLYFGGGTPSLAPLSMLQTIMDAIRQSFTLSDNLEFTMEMDPGTFDLDKLKGFQALGVNRISLGVQSFNDTVLEYLGRFHRQRDIQQSLECIKQVYGCNDSVNYSLDLIASLPGVSLADWCATLTTATTQLDPPPRHISVYDLTIEEGTVFGKWYEDEEKDYARPTISSTMASILPLPTPKESAFMYQYTSGYLRAAGYEHYEISSYAQQGYRSRHNSLYWGYDTMWYAAGLGAASWVDSQRVSRPRAMADYVHWIQNGQPALARDEEDEEEDSILSRLQNVVLTRLRTKEGLDLDWVRHRFGPAYAQAIARGARPEDFPSLVAYESPNLRLVDSTGFLFSNMVLSSIFLELEDVEAT